MFDGIIDNIFVHSWIFIKTCQSHHVVGVWFTVYRQHTIIRLLIHYEEDDNLYHMQTQLMDTLKPDKCKWPNDLPFVLK